jgi:hypothetical protein
VVDPAIRTEDTLATPIKYTQTIAVAARTRVKMLRRALELF